MRPKKAKRFGFEKIFVLGPAQRCVTFFGKPFLELFKIKGGMEFTELFGVLRRLEMRPDIPQGPALLRF